MRLFHLSRGTCDPVKPFLLPLRHAHVKRSAPFTKPYVVKHGYQIFKRSSSDSEGTTCSNLQSLDDNQLQTALNVAIASEDYGLAAQIRDLLKSTIGGSTQPSDWRALGLPDWLAERAERLGFRFPTEVQRRTCTALLNGFDAVIQSATGSGKTLAFVLPCLARLDYPPKLYPDDLKGPQCVLLVPTRELGVQIVLLIFKLFGGSVNSGMPGQSANMFAYSGPKGIKVRGLLLAEEVEAAKKDQYLVGVHVLVATPQLLDEACSGAGALPLLEYVRVLVVDEVDECMQLLPQALDDVVDAACGAKRNTPEAALGPAVPHLEAAEPATAEEADEAEPGTRALVQRSKPQVVLVGATVEAGLVEHAHSRGWLGQYVSIAVGQTGVPRGLQHRYVLVEDSRRLAVLVRLIRQDLKLQGDDQAPTRVIVFAQCVEEAQALASPLRTTLWGEHRLSLLLPQGEDPIKALHAFRDNQSTLLLATPSAARGLDLPAVSHVYNTAVPPDGRAYLHRAGRAGRIGATVPGVVTTLVNQEELPELLSIASSLGLQMEQLPEPPLELNVEGGDVETLKKGLEDLFNLF